MHHLSITGTLTNKLSRLPGSYSNQWSEDNCQTQTREQPLTKTQLCHSVSTRNLAFVRSNEDLFNADNTRLTRTQLCQQQELRLPMVRLFFTYGSCRDELDNVWMSRQLFLHTTQITAVDSLARNGSALGKSNSLTEKYTYHYIQCFYASILKVWTALCHKYNAWNSRSAAPKQETAAEEGQRRWKMKIEIQN